MDTQQDVAGEVADDIDVIEQDAGQDEEQGFDEAMYPDDAPEVVEQDDDGEGDATHDADKADSDAPDEEGDDDGETPEPVPAPHSWSKEDKAVFANLTPEAQAVITRRETERDNFVKQKAFEASQTRIQVTNEARDFIVKMHEDQAQKLAVYAQRFNPQPPEEKLLYSGDPNDVIIFNRQMAAYQRDTDQQQQLHQQIEQARAAAVSEREQSQQAEIASDAQRLQEQLPEWFDPSSGPALKESLQSAGAELGYPVELMAQASSVDILALKKYADLKAENATLRVKAEKLDKLMSKRMTSVRAAKTIPTIARPGNGAAKPITDPVKALYPND